MFFSMEEFFLQAYGIAPRRKQNINFQTHFVFEALPKKHVLCCMWRKFPRHWHIGWLHLSRMIQSCPWLFLNIDSERTGSESVAGIFMHTLWSYIFLMSSARIQFSSPVASRNWLSTGVNLQPSPWGPKSASPELELVRSLAKLASFRPSRLKRFLMSQRLCSGCLSQFFFGLFDAKFDEKIIRNSTFELAMSNCESMQLVSQVRLHDVVFPAGGPDKYLTQKYPDQALSQRKFQVKAPNWTGPRWHNGFFRDPKFGQAAKLDFASWIHRFIPPDPRLLQRKNDSWF